MAGRRVSDALRVKRELAVSRHKAVTKKISRINKTSGAKVSGSGYDPRKPLSVVRNYNSRELAVYTKKLDAFVDRKVQFVPDARSRPMPIKDWKSYKASEAVVNNINQAKYSKVRKIKLPNGFTVEQQLSMTDTIHPQMQNPASDSSHRPTNRKSRTAASLQKLHELEMNMKKRATPKYQADKLATSRESLKTMLESVDPTGAIQARVSKMSNKQFELLWNYSGTFANSISLSYVLLQKMFEDGKNMSPESRAAYLDSAREEYVHIQPILKWIEEQDDLSEKK